MIMTTVEIAVGVWLGGIAIFLSVGVLLALRDFAERNRRLGRPWWRSFRMHPNGHD